MTAAGCKPRADQSGLGLGLGLISEVSDDFAIASRATGGTEVRIRFNLVNADTAGAAAGVAPSASAAATGGLLRLLAVDVASPDRAGNTGDEVGQDRPGRVSAPAAATGAPESAEA